MSSIPLVALMGLSSTHPVQPDNAIEDAALAQRVGAGRQQQAQSAALMPGQLQQQGVQTQLGQQAVESGALQLAQQKAINDAWKQAFVTEPDGTSHLDPNNLTSALAKSGAGAAIPAVQKGFMDMQENIQKIAKGKADLDNLERDAAGAGAQGILSSVGPDGTVPQYARAAFFQMMHNGGYDQEAQAIQQHLQQFKNNPQGEADLWKSIVAASPAQQKLANEHLEAQAKATGAATQAAEFGAKLPGGPLNRVTQDIAVATNPQIQQGKVAVANAEGAARLRMQQQLLTPEAQQMAAQTYAQTGQLPAGMRSPAMSGQILNKAAGAPGGIPNVAANKATYGADTASLKAVQEQFDKVNAFENTALKNLDQVVIAGSKIPDLGARFANIPVRSISANMIGTPEMARFKTALATAQAESAKVLNSANASGVLSDSARHEMQDVIDGNLPYPAMVASINQVKTDFGNRHQAYQQQIGDIKQRISGGGGGTQQSGGAFSVPQGAPPAPAQDGHTLKQAGKAIAVSRGGQWVAPPSQ